MKVVLRGRRPVVEALRSKKRKVHEIRMIAGGAGEILDEIRQLAREHGVRVVEATHPELDGLAEGQLHQGVIAHADELPAVSLDELIGIVKSSDRPGLVVALDEVKDPQNVGAIMRTCDAAGAHGVVITEHRSAASAVGLEKSSAGASETVPLVRVVNLRDALGKLKDAGCWVIGADAAGPKDHFAEDFTGPVVLVLGEEGKGLRDLTRKNCDLLVRVPMAGKIASLNVSATAAILLFEAVRQRAQKH